MDNRMVQTVDSRGLSNFMPCVSVNKDQIVLQTKIPAMNIYAFPYTLIHLANGQRVRAAYSVT